MVMARDIGSSNLGFAPHCAACHNFLELAGGPEAVKTAWLAPVAVIQKENRLQIVWRCSLGDRCVSACIYARGRRRMTDE